MMATPGGYCTLHGQFYGTWTCPACSATPAPLPTYSWIIHTPTLIRIADALERIADVLTGDRAQAVAPKDESSGGVSGVNET